MMLNGNGVLGAVMDDENSSIYIKCSIITPYTFSS